MRRIGDVVHRQTGPWAASVHALLRFLEAEGFAGAPRVVGSGFDAHGRETITYLPGTSPHPGPWPDGTHFALGQLLAEFHRLSRRFTPPKDAVWRDWFGRALGEGERLIGHCDLGDWNILAENGHPVGFIDWEQAGPVDPLVELAQLIWLNAHLFDDALAAEIGLPDATTRIRYAHTISDGYGLVRTQRRQLVDTLVSLAIRDTANEALDARITPQTTEAGIAPWAMAWRARSAAWMDGHRQVLVG